MSAWSWKNFSPAEVACKCCGIHDMDKVSMDRLQAFRDIVRTSVILNSAYRCEKHNRAVGGAPSSQHLKGKAFDVRITDKLSRESIHLVAKTVGFTGIGDYNTFVHIDTGPARYWDLRK